MSNECAAAAPAAPFLASFFPPVAAMPLPWGLSWDHLAYALLAYSAVRHFELVRHATLLFEYFFVSVPTLDVPFLDGPEKDDGWTGPAVPQHVSVRASEGLVSCYCPSTSALLGEMPAMSSTDVAAACARAKSAQSSLAAVSFRRRRTWLRTLQRHVLAEISGICRVCARDSGKTPLDALLGEVLTTCEKLRCTVAHGEGWLAREYRPVGLVMAHKSAYVEYVPLGVLGVIAPWNYPFHNWINHIIAGVFAGNAVVVKVSEHTAWSSGYFGRVIKKSLEANGMDPDLVQIVTGFAEAGAALVSCPDVDKIIFTGSPNVGRKVMAGAAPHLKPVVLELGGKDPVVFCEDVKLADVLPWAMRGSFQNCGQNCCGAERFFVYESILKEFLVRIEEKVRALVQGPPLPADRNVDCGAMVMDAQLGVIQALVDDAVAQGAVLHCGGHRNAALPDGQFYAPTLLSGVTAAMRISQEEVFGPVLCVIAVPDDDDAACVRMVNACPFGLGSSVFSGSQRRAEALGAQLRSGSFAANDYGVGYLVQSLPFGGVGESGFGKFAGPEGLRACCLARAVVVDRIPGVRTAIPPPLDYPIDAPQAMGFGTSLLHVLYNESLLQKLKAIVGLIRSS